MQFTLITGSFLFCAADKMNVMPELLQTMNWNVSLDILIVYPQVKRDGEGQHLDYPTYRDALLFVPDGLQISFLVLDVQIIVD